MAREHDRAREEDSRDQRRMTERLGDGGARPEIARPGKHQGREQQDAERVAGPPGESGAHGLLGLEQAGLHERGHPDRRRDDRSAQRRRKNDAEDVAHPRECRIEPITRAGRPPEEPSRCDRRKRAADCDHCRPGERHAVCGVGGEQPRRNARRKAQAPEHERGDRDPGRRPEQRDVRADQGEDKPQLRRAEAHRGEDEVAGDGAKDGQGRKAGREPGRSEQPMPSHSPVMPPRAGGGARP